MSKPLNSQAPEAPNVRLCEALVKGKSLEELVRRARWRRLTKEVKVKAIGNDNDDENEPKDD